MKVPTAVAARLVSAAVQALLLLVLARQSEPAELATIVAMQAGFGFMTTTLELGIARELTVSAAKRAKSEYQFLSRLHAIGCLVFVALTVIVSAVLDLGYIPPAIAVYAVAERRISALLSAAVAVGKFHTSSMLLMVGRLSLVAVYFSGAALAPGEPVSTYAIAIATTSTLLAISFEFLPELVEQTATKRRPLSEILRVSIHYWIATMLGQVRSLDVVLVTGLVPTSAAALYALPSRSLQPMRLVGTSIAGLAFPVAASGDSKRTTQLLRIATLSASAAIFVVLLVSPFVPRFLNQAVGPEYEAASLAFILMAIGAAINMPGAVLSSILQAKQYQRHITILSVALTIFQFSAIVVLSGIFGINGAAAAVPATFALQLTVTALLYRRIAHE